MGQDYHPSVWFLCLDFGALLGEPLDVFVMRFFVGFDAPVFYKSEVVDEHGNLTFGGLVNIGP